MNRARVGAIGALAVLAAGATLALIARKQEPPRKEPLALLTSLPIVLGEDFSLQGTGSPAMTALSSKFEVRPISTTSTRELPKSLLLMAQPGAQTPENLVALDDWVRRGGRVLLLADPMLEWPSKRRLGDPLRPPPMFADTGLLAHWGLRLDAPDERGPMLRQLGGREIQTVSPGAFFGRCAISQDRLVARCAIGRGKAVLVADADFLNLADMDGPTGNNLPALVTELERLVEGAGR